MRGDSRMEENGGPLSWGFEIDCSDAWTWFVPVEVEADGIHVDRYFIPWTEIDAARERESRVAS